MFIVPADKRTVVNEQNRWEAPQPIGRPELALEREVRDTVLVLRGIWRRTCEQRGQHVTTARVSREATFKVWACSGDKSCGYLLFFGIFTAPATLLVSGVFTAIDVKSSDDRTVQEVSALEPHRSRCDRPAKGWNLIVNAPGREAMFVTTDAGGLAEVDLGDAQLAQTATVVPATPR